MSAMRALFESFWRSFGERRVTALSFLILILAWVGGGPRGAFVDDLFLPSPVIALGTVSSTSSRTVYKSRTIWEHAGPEPRARAVQVFVHRAPSSARSLASAMGYNRKVEAFLQPAHRVPSAVAAARVSSPSPSFGSASTRTPQDYLALPDRPFPVSAIAAMDGVKGSLGAPHAGGAFNGCLGVAGSSVYVVFPSALHEIFTGARLAIGVVYATLIAAEIIAGEYWARLDDLRCWAVPPLGLRPSSAFLVIGHHGLAARSPAARGRA